VYVDDPWKPYTLHTQHTDSLAMFRFGFYPRLFGCVVAILLTSLLLFVACDSGPPTGNGGNDDEEITVTAEVNASDGKTLSSCEVMFSPENGDDVTKTNCTASAEIDKESGTVEVTATADGYQPQVKTTGTTSDAKLSFQLEPDNPDESQVTFPITQADTAVAADLYFADTLAFEDVSEPTATVTFGETVSGRVEGEYFQTKEFTFTANKAEKTVTVELTRRRIEIAVHAADDSSTVGVRNPYTNDSTTAEADVTDTLPARRGDYIAFVRRRAWEYTSQKVGAGSSHDLELENPLITVCENGWDDDDDGEADTWQDENNNDRIDRGEGDPGCPTADDTDEEHVTFQTTIISGGEGTDETFFVSSEQGNQEILFGEIPASFLPESIEDAVANVYTSIETKKEKSEDKERSAAEFACGPPKGSFSNVSQSGLSKDKGRDGWGETVFPDVTGSFFAGGRNCKLYFTHIAKVLDMEMDKKNDVFYIIAGDDTQRALIFRWTVEAEDSHRKTEPAKAEYRDCQKEHTGRICGSTEVYQPSIF